MLRLRMSDLTDTGITVRPHKTVHTKRTARIFEWTAALKQAVEQAKAARPIDFSPWLFCTSKGEGYFNEDSGQATGWDSMWQRFMTRLLKDTDVEERFTEHDLRGKVGSDLASIERATTCSVTRAKRLQSDTIDVNQKSSNPSADPVLLARNLNRRPSQVARILLLTREWGTTPHDSPLFYARKNSERTASANRMGEILIYGGRLLRFS